MNRWIQNIRHERLPSQFVTELSDGFLSFPLLQPLELVFLTFLPRTCYLCPFFSHNYLSSLSVPHSNLFFLSFFFFSLFTHTRFYVYLILDLA